MAAPGDTPHAGGLVTSAVVFYAAMSAIGAAILSAQGLDFVPTVFGDGLNTVRDALLGAGSGLAIVGLTWLVRNLPAVVRLNAELSPLLSGLDTPGIAVLAVTSAVGEELLFRGALQPLLGLWPTVAIFGLMHGGTHTKLLLWAVFATVAGLLLGLLTVYTGNLLAAILCHLTVNFWNLHVMAAPSPPSPPEAR